jgi:YbbR domain-containing protein
MNRNRRANRVTARLIAATLAILLWVYVQSVATVASTGGDVSRTIQNVRVTWRGGSSNLALMSQSVDRVNVTVWGPQSEVQALDPSQIVAYVNLSGLGPGTIEQPISVDTPPGIRWAAANPQVLKVTLEAMVTKELPVTVQLSGEPEAGFVLGPAKLVPATASVVAPESVVNRVSSLAAEVNMDGARSDFSGKLIIVARDGRGNKVDLVSISPGEIDVLVPVLSTKTVAVKLDRTGELPQGITIVSEDLSPKGVVVAGPTDQIAAFPNEITTEPFDLTKVTDSGTFDVKLLPLPEGFSVVGETIVKLTLAIERRP